MRLKALILIFLLCSFGLTIYLFNPAKIPKKDKTPAVSSQEKSDSPEIKPTAELNDMEYTEVEDGRILWKIYAKVARYYQEDKKTVLSDVVVRFFLEDGSFIKLSSREGIIYAGVKNLELHGNVSVNLPQNYSFNSDRVFYSNSKKKIYSDTPLRISGPCIKGVVKSWSFDVKAMKGYGEGGVNIVLCLQH